MPTASGTKADLKTAAEWFERAASAGLTSAQYRLAAMYERGIGVHRDLGRAQTWYEAAAEGQHQGDAQSRRSP